jgi:hypothetical protein
MLELCPIMSIIGPNVNYFDSLWTYVRIWEKFIMGAFYSLIHKSWIFIAMSNNSMFPENIPLFVVVFISASSQGNFGYV